MSDLPDERDEQDEPENVAEAMSAMNDEELREAEREVHSWKLIARRFVRANVLDALRNGRLIDLKKILRIFLGH